MTSRTDAVSFLNALISNVNAGIVSFDIDGSITMINAKALEYLALDGEVRDYIDTPILDCISLADVEAVLQDNTGLHRYDFHINSVAFGDRHLIVDGKALLDGTLLSITDITAEVLAKDKATQSLLTGQEIERRRLAKEIHDGIGPSMSTLRLHVDAIKRRAADAQTKEDLDHLSSLISEIASEIRQVSHDLMPSSLVDFGVVTALANYAKRIARTGEVDVTYTSTIADRYLTRQHELNIYRIVQELVNNALKYSTCTTIRISLTEDHDKLTIIVADDGSGMDMTTQALGNGLSNLNSRIASLQGSIDIQSAAGKGLCATIQLPIKTSTL